MKKKKLLLALLLATALIAGTAGAQDITTGLTGHWNLNDGSGTTAIDSSPYLYMRLVRCFQYILQRHTRGNRYMGGGSTKRCSRLYWDGLAILRLASPALVRYVR
ncbi:MAG: hypothetical protein KAJ46_08465 [Sedimentisphaerales bacterium]|nr:hypothetical protein [Sedimentisphaerales bacterium]